MIPIALQTLISQKQAKTFRGWLATDDVAPVFIVSGQSNAQGYGDVDLVGARTELAAPITGVKMWVEGVAPTFDTMHPAVNTQGAVDFGPEVPVAYRIRQILNSAGITKDIHFIKHTRSGTGLVLDAAANSFHPDEQAESFWDLSRQVIRAYDALIDQGKMPFLAGFFWVQGEHDSGNEAKSLAYGAALIRLYSAVSELTRIQAVNLPPVVFGDGLIYNNFSYSNTVRAAKTAYAAGNPYAFTAEMDDLPDIADDVHVNTTGIIELGERFATGWEAITLNGSI